MASQVTRAGGEKPDQPRKDQVIAASAADEGADAERKRQTRDGQPAVGEHQPAAGRRRAREAALGRAVTACHPGGGRPSRLLGGGVNQAVVGDSAPQAGGVGVAAGRVDEVLHTCWEGLEDLGAAGHEHQNGGDERAHEPPTCDHVDCGTRVQCPLRWLRTARRVHWLRRAVTSGRATIPEHARRSLATLDQPRCNRPVKLVSIAVTALVILSCATSDDPSVDHPADTSTVVDAATATPDTGASEPSDPGIEPTPDQESPDASEAPDVAMDPDPALPVALRGGLRASGVLAACCRVRRPSVRRTLREGGRKADGGDGARAGVDLLDRADRRARLPPAVARWRTLRDDDRFDVFLWRGQEESFVDVLDSNDATPDVDDWYSYLVVDPWGRYGGALLPLTIAHELNHACQASDDWFETWAVFEWTSTWIESLVDDELDWTFVLQDFQLQPDWALDYYDDTRPGTCTAPRSTSTFWGSGTSQTTPRLSGRCGSHAAIRRGRASISPSTSLTTPTPSARASRTSTGSALRTRSSSSPAGAGTSARATTAPLRAGRPLRRLGAGPARRQRPDGRGRGGDRARSDDARQRLRTRQRTARRDLHRHSGNHRPAGSRLRLQALPGLQAGSDGEILATDVPAVVQLTAGGSGSSSSPPCPSGSTSRTCGPTTAMASHSRCRRPNTAVSEPPVVTAAPR